MFVNILALADPLLDQAIIGGFMLGFFAKIASISSKNSNY
jgi:hypothetical protein